MLLAQLEALTAIAAHGSLSRAAKELFVTQPALTSRLQRLERELGVQLFVRTRHGMRLTDEGAAFLPHAERALEAVADGRALMAELARGERGHVAVGAAPAVSTYVLPAVLARFSARHPGVQLGVRTGHSEQILDLVLRKQVHVGLVRALRHPEIESVPCYADELVLVVSPEHPFSSRDGVSIGQLAGEQLVLFDRTSSYNELTSARFRAAGVTPRGVLELDNIEAAKKVVQLGLGVALLPQTAVAPELASGALCAVQIVDAEPVRRQIVAIRRREPAALSYGVNAFLETLRECLEGPGQPGQHVK